MSTISNKLEYLNNTKQLIGNAIKNKGGNITSSTTFKNYVTQINNIPDITKLGGFQIPPSATQAEVNQIMEPFKTGGRAQLTSAYSLFANSPSNRVFPEFDKSKIQDASFMYTGCRGLNNINFNMPSCTKLNGSFDGCTSLSNFSITTTSNLIELNDAFFGCTGITEFVHPEFNTSGVWTWRGTFMNCTNLKKAVIDVRGAWDTLYTVFQGCPNLTYCFMDNFGYNMDEYDLSLLENWGRTDLPGSDPSSASSVENTLLYNSANRIGKPCKIYLSNQVIARIDDVVFYDLEGKGYTVIGK